ncbi:MAG: ATP-binding protein [Holophaga sp.]|nr:ATP-binding protein [Holophaga sp.]
MPEDSHPFPFPEPDPESLRPLRALDAARRNQTRFLAALGHELRNPLMPIRNSVALMRRARPGDPIIQQAQEIIERQVAHMIRLVDDLLDVSRMATGRISLAKEELDLADLVAAALAEQRPLLEANGVALDYQAPGKPVRAFADPARITQMVNHLLNNANKFTDRGGRVTVSLRANGDGHAVLSVRDEGIGMEPDTLGRLFEPFIQDLAVLGPAHGGLGLGLALVKGLAALHGGTVSAWSDGPGRGSEFTLRLPLLKAGTPPQPRLPAAAVPGGIRPRRILIVEDLLDAAITMELLLEMMGHDVEVAADGQTGLDKARSFEPEIILCDIGLPGQMNGYEVARTIRGASSLKPPFLVALTGFGTAEDRAKARLAGFDLHLTKPIDPASLEPLIASIP